MPLNGKKYCFAANNSLETAIANTLFSTSVLEADKQELPSVHESSSLRDDKVQLARFGRFQAVLHFLRRGRGSVATILAST